jgi:hypothetical protein
VFTSRASLSKGSDRRVEDNPVAAQKSGGRPFHGERPPGTAREKEKSKKRALQCYETGSGSSRTLKPQLSAKAPRTRRER